MFPIVAIGGAISAVASVVKGVSWLSDHLGSSKTGSATDGKTDATSQATTQVSPFAAALAAQSAGQVVPPSAVTATPSASPTTAVSMMQSAHGPDYDTLARMRAGIAAYGHVGQQHHGNRAGADRPAGSDDTRQVAQA